MIDHRIFLRFMCMVRHNGVGGGAASCLAAEGSGVLGEGDEERGDGGRVRLRHCGGGGAPRMQKRTGTTSTSPSRSWALAPSATRPATSGT